MKNPSYPDVLMDGERIFQIIGKYGYYYMKSWFKKAVKNICNKIRKTKVYNWVHSFIYDKLNPFLKELGDDLSNRRFTLKVKVCLAICILLIVASFVGCYFLFGKKNSSVTDAGEIVTAQEEYTPDTQDVQVPAGDVNYDKDAAIIDTERLKETIVDESADAGQSYIDETLFIGDSNTVRMMNYGFTSLSNTLAVTGMGIQSVTSLKCIEFEGYSAPVTMVEAVKLMQPRRIIITFGTNNAGGMDVDTFIKKYKEALGELHNAYPYADILINAVPPFHKINHYPSLSMTMVDKYNVALADMAEELGYKFLNSADLLKDEKTGYAKDEYTVNDGIHITKEGFSQMFNYFRTHSVSTEDTRPKPLQSIPKQKGTVYVISGDGKISHDPKAFGDMSDKDAPVTLAEPATPAAPVAPAENKEVTQPVIQPEVQKKHEHREDGGKIIKEASYDENGIKVFTCTECGEEVRREEIPKLVKKEEPKKEEPKKEDPKKEDPKKEEPKVEEPKPEEPKPEGPKQEEPQPEEPKQEEPKQEEPKPEEPKQEEPKQEEPQPEEPKQEEPKQEEPKSEEPKQEEPKAESEGESSSAETTETVE